MESLSQREPGVAAELGPRHSFFQLPARHSASDLHHQQRGITEPVAAQDHQSAWRISQRRGSAEITVSRSAAGGEEVDHADSSLARSAQPLHHSVAGADASFGESCAMNARKASTEMGRGRGNYPLPLHPIPKYKTPVVYTEELTHLRCLIFSYSGGSKPCPTAYPPC